MIDNLCDSVRYALVATLLALSALPLVGQDHSLTICDAEERLPLPGVVLRSRTWTGISDAEGRARVPSSAGSGGMLTGSYIGYESFSLPLPLLRDTTIYMHPTEALLGDVEVTAQRSRKERTMVGEVLSADDLRRSVGSDLTDVLASVKGISSISSSSGESVPVIHGLSGNRILVVRDGIRQELQQWSTDLGASLPAGHAGRITVLKGAESVRYGSDALGGVILVDSPLLPYGMPTAGEVTAEYGSNGRRYGADVRLKGSPARPIAYQVQSSYHTGGDRSTARYLLNNTGSRAADLDLHIGWQGRRDEVELLYNLSNHRDGIYYGAQMGSVDQLEERIRLGRPVEVGPFARTIDYPYHHTVHHNLRLLAEHRSETLGTLRLQLAYQRDRRREYHYRRMDRSGMPSVSLTLDNLQGNLTWTRKNGSWSTEVGTEAVYTDNYNEPGTGVVPLIPNYVRLAGGLFGVLKYHRDRLDLEAGGRLDLLYLHASGIDLYSRPYGGERRYPNATAMAAAHYSLLPSLSLTTQLGTAWRAPHVSELWSEGLDAAGGLYLRGDDTMESERGVKWITSVDYHSPHVTASVEGYLQWIEGYIYKAPTGELFPVLSGVYPLFRYRQTAAFLRGVDGEVTLRLLDRLSYRLMGGLVVGSEQSTGRYLPYIPPLRLAQTIELRIPSDCSTLIALTHRYVAEQRRIDPEQDLIPYAPPAYHLLSLEAATEIPLPHRQSLSLHFTITNLLNTEYKEYTNLSRYYAHDLGRDVRCAVTYHF